MARFRRKRSGGRKGGGMNSRWMPFMGLILGCVMLFFTMIAFGIVLSSWDTSYTTAATYTEQVGVTDVMGIIPLLFFVVFQAVGVGALTGTAVVSYRGAAAGDAIGMMMAIMMAAIGGVIAVIMWNMNQAQLHTVYTTANATTNIASFDGLLTTITAFGIVDLIAIVSPALAGIVGVGVGGYRKAKAAF